MLGARIKVSRILIQLGKLGDVLNVLPILWADAQAGQRATLMIHRQYEGILDGVSYCDRLVWDGNPNDINGAIAEAQKHSQDVRCCQIVGDPQAVKQLYERSGTPGASTESFQKESWRVCGRLALWKDQPPLVFDQRNREREKELLGRVGSSRNKKYLLVAVDSKTSPFPYKALLWEMLRLKFKTGYIIVDLAEYQAERIYDLLGLYEKAWALIACDSALLHLANAVRTLPVVALAQDKPTLWHGSSWRPQFISYIRYGDFPDRAVDMLRALDQLHQIGCYFTQHNGQSIVHAYHEYDRERGVVPHNTWELEYLNGSWIRTPSEYGVFGKDSLRRLKDDKRVPFVKDVIRMASMRARDNDLICLTRHDTCVRPGLTKKILAQHPCFSHRMTVDGDIMFHHPAIDLFAFTKSWWQQHQAELPDFVMGKDNRWDRVFMELMKLHGGTEIKEAVYQCPQ